MRRQPGEASASEIQRLTQVASRGTGNTFAATNPNKSTTPGFMNGSGRWTAYPTFPMTFPITLKVAPVIAGAMPAKFPVTMYPRLSLGYSTFPMKFPITMRPGY